MTCRIWFEINFNVAVTSSERNEMDLMFLHNKNQHTQTQKHNYGREVKGAITLIASNHDHTTKIKSNTSQSSYEGERVWNWAKKKSFIFCSVI